MKKLIKLFKKYNRTYKMNLNSISIYDDGSGNITGVNGDIIFTFHSIKQLKKHLKNI
jgi:hypothetical protein